MMKLVVMDGYFNIKKELLKTEDFTDNLSLEVDNLYKLSKQFTDEELAKAFFNKSYNLALDNKNINNRHLQITKKDVFTIKDIDSYSDQFLTSKQSEELIDHCNLHQIFPEIVAIYDSMKDLIERYKKEVGHITDKEIIDTVTKKYKKYYCFFSDGKIVKL